jgi:hypothetical protein
MVSWTLHVEHRDMLVSAAFLQGRWNHGGCGAGSCPSYPNSEGQHGGRKLPFFYKKSLYLESRVYSPELRNVVKQFSSHLI